MASERPKLRPDDILRVVARDASRAATGRDRVGDDRAARWRLSEFEQISEQLSALDSADQVVDAVLDRLGIDFEVSDAQLSRIPEKGPLVVVCGQTFGTVEALVMYQTLKLRRPDVRVFANLLLSGFPQLHDAATFIDPGWRLASRVRNVLSLKAAMRHVDGGGALCVLPTNETITFDHDPWHVVDPTWEQGVADVIVEAGATVLPVAFRGNDGALHGLGGLLAPALGGMLSKFADSPRRTITVEIGQPIRPADLQRHEGELGSQYLRDRSDILLRRGVQQAKRTAPDQSGFAPVAEAGDVDAIEAEILALPDSQKLVENRGRLVAYARGNECPALLQEIGRLRQVAFRAVGEGTAEPRDLDRFDHYYDHMFVWNDKTREVIGAYRLGRIDELPEGEGLYSSTLFEYTDSFFTRLGPALELGRSFVRPEYQRSPAGLIMLWKGIGQYLCRNPRYRYLLGPVSMSADFTLTSHQLMVRYMETYAGAGEWEGTVIPRTPFDPEHQRELLWKRYGRWCTDLTELGRWVSSLEAEDRTVPVLVKSYLGLGGRMLAFNVDPDFGDCIDGLVLVDLTRTPLATLEQFMGKAQAHGFLAHHPEAGAPGGSQD